MRSATGASRHDRCGANRTTRRSGVMNPASASPTAAIRVPARERVHHARDGGLQRRLAARGGGAGGVEDGAVAVDHAGAHAGTADVDPDGQHGVTRRRPPCDRIRRDPPARPSARRDRGAALRRPGRRGGAALVQGGAQQRDEPARVLGQPLHQLGTLAAQRGHQRAHAGRPAQVSARHRGGRFDAQPVEHGLQPVQRGEGERPQLGRRPGVRVAPRGSSSGPDRGVGREGDAQVVGREPRRGDRAPAQHRRQRHQPPHAADRDHQLVADPGQLQRAVRGARAGPAPARTRSPPRCPRPVCAAPAAAPGLPHPPRPGRTSP